MIGNNEIDIKDCMMIISEQQTSIGLSLAWVEAEKAQQEQSYPIGAVITSLEPHLKIAGIIENRSSI